jgi:hypothetical protein
VGLMPRDVKYSGKTGCNILIAITAMLTTAMTLISSRLAILLIQHHLLLQVPPGKYA